MERPPEHEPDDPAADTGRFQAFIQDEETENARTGAPGFPAGLLAVLVLVGIVVVTAILLLRG